MAFVIRCDNPHCDEEEETRPWVPETWICTWIDGAFRHFHSRACHGTFLLENPDPKLLTQLAEELRDYRGRILP